MSEICLGIAVFLPIIGAVLIAALPIHNRVYRNIALEILAVATSVLVWCLILNRPAGSIEIMEFTGELTITFKLDGLGMVFAGIIATLWPLAMLYSFEYMKEVGRERAFFLFYMVTYGITLAISMSGNLMTMYLFYEMLTLVTVPLVMHTMTREAILASRTYLYYSLGGAAFAFVGFIFILTYGSSIDFTYGGVLNMASLGDRADILRLIYVFAFMGFGVKAAVCPFNKWLPKAGVAPTPVTALLHAVAVVKSGAFAVMRITYYSFGTEILKGSWAQYVVMTVTIITIVYGCSRAVKEQHFKRRLAYSTISNLSYILFGACIMTPLGLLGALTHMVFHAVMKICSFFCAGAVIHKTERNYVHELDGLGRNMPMTFGIFTLSGLALMGVPGMCGFISKWYLTNAAVESGFWLAWVGIAGLLISALLTAIYMMTVSLRAFFPGKDFDYSKNDGCEDPNWLMLLPLTIFIIAIFYFGLHSQPLVDVLTQVANGLY